MLLPELKITVFSDYICPFCYLGHHRLQRLRDSYDLKINWCFLEIHPETSASGEPVDSLNYPSQQWQKMMDNLELIAKQENITLAKLTFTTNSKDALLLSEAAKQCGHDIFYKLHEGLFHAYFVEEKNIGERDTLMTIAKFSGMKEATVNNAWSEKKYQQRLQENYNTARKYEIQSVPAFIFGEKVLTGVVTEATMREAAQQCCE